MYGQENRKSQRTYELMLNVVHIVIGAFIVVLAVLAFLNPEQNILLFPVIFFLAAFLNLINGVSRLRLGKREKKKKISGAAQVLFCILLTVLGIVSGFSIWRG